MKLAADYAALHNLTLDNNTYQDLGLSAFTGKNYAEGMLGAFIKAIDLGKILKGSYLLVEALDRLTRTDINIALQLLQKITNSGIILVTLQDGQVYSAERNIQDHGIGLIISIMKLSQGHEESAKKQFRVSEAWKAKRAEAVTGKKMSAIAPAWLKLSDDRMSWIEIPEKVEIVRRIFDLSLTGMGTPTMAKLFNSERIPTMQRAKIWTFGTINAILKNESVTGTYTPKKVESDSIKGYYPKIVSDSKYYQVRETLKKRQWVGGHNVHRVLNLFSGISFCGHCGSPMRVKSAITGSKTYLNCQTAKASDHCKAKIFPYYAAERLVLNHLAKQVAELTINKERHDPRVALEGKKADINIKLENLIDAMLTLKSNRLKERYAKLQIEFDEVNEELAKAVDPILQEDAVIEALEIFAKLKKPEILTVEERLNVQTKLKKVISEIKFLYTGKLQPDSKIVEVAEPTIVIFYADIFGRQNDIFSVKPFMDKVGGNRRKPLSVKL
jgi:DNA invertase Pin-like site-specific DNA recombinase